MTPRKVAIRSFAGGELRVTRSGESSIVFTVLDNAAIRPVASWRIHKKAAPAFAVALKACLRELNAHRSAAPAAPEATP